MYKNIDAPVLTRVWQELEAVVHTSNIFSRKKTFSVFLWL
jgi:hypothetical protein